MRVGHWDDHRKAKGVFPTEQGSNQEPIVQEAAVFHDV